jgi:hypothetical protein
MITKAKWLFLAVIFSLFSHGVNGQDQQPQSGGVVLNVNDLAAKPAEHLGQVRLVGVVAGAVTRRPFTSAPL